MSKATPRPWRTEYNPSQKGTPATLIMQADAEIYEKWLAECPWGKDGDTDVADGDGTRDCTAAEAQANAKLIVQAVNCHDDLLAACKRLIAAEDDVRVSLTEALALARAAIAKAERNEPA